ncbi:LysR family transcriptional regulator [Vibrio sp. 10N.222.54.B6]|uniref:LysR family transcriptional regulator n=1 Tax=Vibrio sp. 10N.222.54.B6 TaxID=1884468 RepID=UPI000C84B583|nr:LysR family transcriptional regulator [Vibrio sp. 10N.222.54.B6]PMO17092.1 LysR family transcriptional regulator [Vibrio sp. 10N.222.54.B6]
MLTRSDDLEMVLTVVDAGGFSAAAEALGVQVAKVSRSVSKVELQLGVSIFNRTTRRVELTEEGRQFVDSVRVGLQMIQSAKEEIVSRGELPKGRLRVDAASPFVFHQLVPLVQSFKEAYPDIELELTSNEGFVDLLEKRTDVAIRIGKLSDSTLHARPLGKSLLHIVASPDYLAKRGVPTKPEDLSSHQIVGFAGNKVLNHWPLPNQSDVAPTVTASNGETVRQLVLAGNGIACLSGFMVQEDMAAGRLIPILEQDKLANTDRERVNAVYYKSSSVSKRISAFIDLIQPRLKL